MRKRIGTHGARAVPGQSTLVISLADTAGAIHGLQFISADGMKKFFLGSKVTGHFFLIGDTEPSAPLYIAEGFATAAAIHEAMGGQVAVAFNAGNLKPAAKALRQQWLDRPFVPGRSAERDDFRDSAWKIRRTDARQHPCGWKEP